MKIPQVFGKVASLSFAFLSLLSYQMKDRGWLSCVPFSRSRSFHGLEKFVRFAENYIEIRIFFININRTTNFSSIRRRNYNFYVSRTPE